MSSYILSILGVVVAGVLIDIIIPSGAINKYVKSIFSIFVVVVLINPVTKFLSNTDFKLNYDGYQVDEKLLNYIYNKQTEGLESIIENELTENGLRNIDIILTFSTNNSEIEYKFCTINLSKMVIDADKQHINSYEFIQNVVIKHTSLTQEEIVFNE